MKRKRYNNGDEITLQATGCDGCSPSRINGILCHETGCPEAWRDRMIECVECGHLFRPKMRGQQTCTDCARAAW